MVSIRRFQCLTPVIFCPWTKVYHKCSCRLYLSHHFQIVYGVTGQKHVIWIVSSAIVLVSHNGGHAFNNISTDRQNRDVIVLRKWQLRSGSWGSQGSSTSPDPCGQTWLRPDGRVSWFQKRPALMRNMPENCQRSVTGAAGRKASLQ